MEELRSYLRTHRHTLEWLASQVGLSRHTVKKWRRVPAEYVLRIEALTGISRHRLRPDVFGAAPALEGQAA